MTMKSIKSKGAPAVVGLPSKKVRGPRSTMTSLWTALSKICSVMNLSSWVPLNSRSNLIAVTKSWVVFCWCGSGKQENVSLVVILKYEDFTFRTFVDHWFPTLKFSNPYLLLSSGTGYQIFQHGFQISRHVHACKHVILGPATPLCSRFP